MHLTGQPDLMLTALVVRMKTLGVGVVTRDGAACARVGNTRPDLRVDDVTGAGDVTSAASGSGILYPGGRNDPMSSCFIRNLSSGDFSGTSASGALYPGGRKADISSGDFTSTSGSGALYPGGRKADMSSCLMRNLSSGDFASASGSGGWTRNPGGRKPEISVCLNGLLSGGLAVLDALTSGPSASSGSLNPGGRNADISSCLIKNLSSGDLVAADAFAGSTSGPSGPSGSSGSSGSSGILNPGGSKAEISSCLTMSSSSGDGVVVVSPEGLGFRNPGGKNPEMAGGGLILGSAVVTGISGPSGPSGSSGSRNPGGRKAETSSILLIVGATKSSGRRFRNPGGRKEMTSSCLSAGVADVVGASKLAGSKLAASAALDFSSSRSNNDSVVGVLVVVVDGGAVDVGCRKSDGLLGRSKMGRLGVGTGAAGSTGSVGCAE